MTQSDLGCLNLYSLFSINWESTSKIFLNIHLDYWISLCSKHFRGVGEQRKSEERDFRCFARAKNGARAKKRKEREEKGKEGNACRQSPGIWKPATWPLMCECAPFFAQEKHRKSHSFFAPNSTETLATQATTEYVCSFHLLINRFLFLFF